MNWWQNKKQREKAYLIIFLFFCWVSSFAFFTIRGLFASEAEKKKSCIAWYVTSFHCSVCFSAFSAEECLNLSFRLMWTAFFFIRRSVHLVFPFTSDQPWQLKTCHPLEVVFIIIISMYWQTNVCAPVNSEVQTHTCAHFCPLKTCDQPDPIPCNHLELPHAPTYCSASIPSNGLGQGAEAVGFFPLAPVS